MCQPFTRLGGGREGTFRSRSSLQVAGRYELYPQKCHFRLRVRTVKDSSEKLQLIQNQRKKQLNSFIYSIKGTSQLLERNTQAQLQDIFIYILVWSNSQIFTKNILVYTEHKYLGKSAFQKQHLRVPAAPLIHHLEYPYSVSNLRKQGSKGPGNMGNTMHWDRGMCPQTVRVCTWISLLWFHIGSDTLKHAPTATWFCL